MTGPSPVCLTKAWLSGWCRIVSTSVLSRRAILTYVRPILARLRSSILRLMPIPQDVPNVPIQLGTCLPPEHDMIRLLRIAVYASCSDQSDVAELCLLFPSGIVFYSFVCCRSRTVWDAKQSCTIGIPLRSDTHDTTVVHGDT